MFMRKILSNSEAEAFVLRILREANRPMSMSEIKERVGDAECRDGLPRLLGKMRYKNLIKGQISTEKKEWVWWL